MFDPRLQSIHLELAPRRNEFRRARQRVQNAIGTRTLVGDLCINLAGDNTLTSSKSTTSCDCWLLDKGKQFGLKVGLNSIGRLPDNDIVLDDATVSRRHCAIVVHSDLSVELHDVASKNGTTINGKQLNGSVKLKDGDVIVLCEHKVVFVKNAGAKTVDRPRPPRFCDDVTLAG
ncbi:MAG: FHA domain-containing protein [Planctomycetes bacterium]|nr:FHA domain-containing protein [Planctomycetota bacterium]